MNERADATQSSDPSLAAVRDALVIFDEISRKRFAADFDTLASNPNRNKAAAQMRFLVGVALKKDYSDERRINDSHGALIDYKWRINSAKLDAIPNTVWSLQLLERSPDRQPHETGKDVALRLRRETLLQRCYFAIVHPYLCQTPEMRRQIKAILKEFGLGEFADLSSPKGLLKLGSASLFGLLSAQVSVLPAGAIAVTAVTICVIGLDRICKTRSHARNPQHEPLQNS